MKGKEGLKLKIKRALELDELLGERDVLEMRGSSELTVRECGRILSYSESEIKLSLREYILSIRGEELFCSSYLGGIVRVDGEIFSLDIQRRERKNEKREK